MEPSSSSGFDPLSEPNLTRSLNLVKAIASEIQRKLPRSVEFDDLYQNGVLGLMEAVKKYDGSKGVPFMPYARFRIRGAILDGLRKADQLSRHHRKLAKLAAETDAMPAPITISASAPRLPGGSESNSIEANLPADPMHSPYHQFQGEQSRRLLNSALDELPERYRHMMHLLFHEGLRASEVARRFQVNESRVSQMRGTALRRISAKFEQNGLRCADFLEAAC
ncbi:MAG: sigma-70 family RNA polymerase sigma factor [Bryobacteraceae bacterium]